MRTGARICAQVFDLPAPVVELPHDDPRGVPIRQGASAADLTAGCTEHLRLGRDPGLHYWLWDFSTGEEIRLTWPGGYRPWSARVFGASALIVGSSSDDMLGKLDGWIWSRERGFQLIVDPGDDNVYQLLTDGETLAWIQTDRSVGLFDDPKPGTLWTSPFADDPSGIVPEQRRELGVVRTAPLSYAMGAGHIAMLHAPPGKDTSRLHVYSVTDGRHWESPALPDLADIGGVTVPTKVLHVDAEEVWYEASSTTSSYKTIVRQRIAALPSGD
jgi:hypothetical protein